MPEALEVPCKHVKAAAAKYSGFRAFTDKGFYPASYRDDFEDTIRNALNIASLFGSQVRHYTYDKEPRKTPQFRAILRISVSSEVV